MHVWVQSLHRVEQHVDCLLGALSDEERRRVGRYRRLEDQRRSIVARSTLRLLLGRYLGLPAHDVELAQHPGGKPCLAGGLSATQLEFNLSDAHELVALAFTVGSPVGVDVEHVHRRVDTEAVAARFFAPGEVAALRLLEGEQRRLAFFRCWTRKEAFLKATGEGLRGGLDSFDVSVGPGSATSVLACDGSARRGGSWSMRDIEVPAGYVGTVVVRGDLSDLTVRPGPLGRPPLT